METTSPTTTTGFQRARLAKLAIVMLSMLALSGCGINTIPTYEQNAKAAWSEVSA